MTETPHDVTERAITTTLLDWRRFGDYRRGETFGWLVKAGAAPNGGGWVCS